MDLPNDKPQGGDTGWCRHCDRLIVFDGDRWVHPTAPSVHPWTKPNMTRWTCPTRPPAQATMAAPR